MSDGEGPRQDVEEEEEDPCGVTHAHEHESERRMSDSVGLALVPADGYGGGYKNFSLRASAKDCYLAAYRHVQALGGILTSSGAIRDLGAQVTAGRSRTSLHYTGRAIDLYIYTGMHGTHDRYLVAKDGGTDALPEWKVYCVSVDPKTDDEDYDSSLIVDGEIEYAIWKRGVGFTTARRTAQYFCLSDVLGMHGWRGIPSRSLWRTDYTSVEWWHFQYDRGLEEGVTRFGDDLKGVWPANVVARSGLALNAVWRGRSFQ